jgi:hypothetical protein
MPPKIESFAIASSKPYAHRHTYEVLLYHNRILTRLPYVLHTDQSNPNHTKAKEEIIVRLGWSGIKSSWIKRIKVCKM